MVSAGKLFNIVPDKMNKVHFRFRSAKNGIDSYNVQAKTEIATCEGVLQHIPDEIGFFELYVKRIQINKFRTAAIVDQYDLKGSVIFGLIKTCGTCLLNICVM